MYIVKTNFRKAELPLEGIFFALNFLLWEFFLVKKLEIKKTKTTKNTNFKTDIIKVVLVFSSFINDVQRWYIDGVSYF